MPRRFSKADRKKRSARMKRLNADPRFAAKRDAAARTNLKRLGTDPAFAAKRDAASRAAMKRLHRKNPGLAAAAGARLRRLNSDPVFAARRNAAVSATQSRLRGISAATRAAITAALEADPNASRVVRIIGGVGYKTVLKIAREAGIRLWRGGRPRRRLRPYV